MANIRFSEERNELFKALATARKAFKPVIKRSKNPFFKSQYADLAEILDATVEALSDNGLCVSQFPSMDDSGHVIITTLVGHSSGQWMEGDLPMPVSKADAQGTGSAITYGRRYAYGAVVNVASENDDDGNAAVGNHKVVEAEEKFNERTGQGKAGEVLIRAFWSAFKGSGKTDAQLATILRTRYSTDSVENLTASELSELVSWSVGKEPIEATLKTSVEAATRTQERQLDTSVSQDKGERADGLQYVPVKITKIVTRTKKPLRMVEAIGNSGPITISCWHEGLYPILDSEATPGVNAIFQIMTKTKEGKTYHNLEHIKELNQIEYVDDKPVLDFAG